MNLVKQSLFGNSKYDLCANIYKHGDLIHDCYLEFNGITVTDADADDNVTILPTVSTVEGIYNLGTSLIDSVEVNIDNICIDKHYGHWLETWFQLTIPNCKPHYTIYNDGNEIINGDIPNNFQRMSLSGGVITNNYMNFT